MARGLNKVMLIGRLGSNPELRHTGEGTAVTNFTMATNEVWTDKRTGEKKEKAEWHRIVAFGKLGEICEEYLSKGRQVYIEGRIQTRSWEYEGAKRYKTEIVASEMQILDSKNSSNSECHSSSGGEKADTGESSTENKRESDCSDSRSDVDIPF